MEAGRVLAWAVVVATAGLAAAAGTPRVAWAADGSPAAGARGGGGRRLLQACPDGTYGIPPTCAACHEACTTCSGPGSSQCLSCSPGYVDIDPEPAGFDCAAPDAELPSQARAPVCKLQDDDAGGVRYVACSVEIIPTVDGKYAARLLWTPHEGPGPGQQVLYMTTANTLFYASLWLNFFYAKFNCPFECAYSFPGSGGGAFLFPSDIGAYPVPTCEAVAGCAEGQTQCVPEPAKCLQCAAPGDYVAADGQCAACPVATPTDALGPWIAVGAGNGVGSSFWRALTWSAEKKLFVAVASFAQGGTSVNMETGRGALKISPSSLAGAGAKSRVARKLAELDTDNNGELDVAEVCAAVEQLSKAERERRYLKWALLIAAGVCLLTIAATAGLTYAVVALSQEIDTNDSGTLLVAGTNTPVAVASTDFAVGAGGALESKAGGGTVATAKATSTEAAAETLARLAALPDDEAAAALAALTTVTLAGAEPGERVTVLRVAEAALREDGGLRVTSSAGTRVVWAADGSLAVNATGGGRRLLARDTSSTFVYDAATGCPAGSYPVVANGATTCAACAEGCTTCTGPYSSQCTACKSGYTDINPGAGFDCVAPSDELPSQAQAPVCKLADDDNGGARYVACSVDIVATPDGKFNVGLLWTPARGRYKEKLYSALQDSVQNAKAFANYYYAKFDCPFECAFTFPDSGSGSYEFPADIDAFPLQTCEAVAGCADGKTQCLPSPASCTACISGSYVTSEGQCSTCPVTTPTDKQGPWTGIGSANGVGSSYWRALTRSAEKKLFVAVAAYAQVGTSNFVMTSPDGLDWTVRDAPPGSWRGVAYGGGGGGKFVAVGGGGETRVMTSQNGATWVKQDAAEQNEWRSVAYGNGVFVAVASTGTNRAMTSPDGIKWTARATPEGACFRHVIFAGDQFVAVGSLPAYDGNPECAGFAATSPDGVEWTLRTTGVDGSSGWVGVGYRPDTGLLVAVANYGPTRAMTSADGGATWQGVASGVRADVLWWSVVWAADQGLWTAVSSNSGAAMVSADGRAWTLKATPNGAWYAVTYAPELKRWAAVSYVYYPKSVMVAEGQC